MELKVWVEGIQRIVCGVTDATTCQDVVYAFAHATGKTGRFTLVEKWRHNERMLPPQERLLKVLSKWGEYASDVQLVLRRSALDASTRTGSESLHALPSVSPKSIKVSSPPPLIQPSPSQTQETTKKSPIISITHNHHLAHQDLSQPSVFRDTAKERRDWSEVPWGVVKGVPQQREVPPKLNSAYNKDVEEHNGDNSHRTLRGPVNSVIGASATHSAVAPGLIRTPTHYGNSDSTVPKVHSPVNSQFPSQELMCTSPPSQDTHESYFINQEHYESSGSSPSSVDNGGRSLSGLVHLGTPKSRRNLLSEFKRHDLEEELRGGNYLGSANETKVVFDKRYHDLVHLVNLQREKLDLQEAHLTKYDAEISYWEAKHKEHKQHVKTVELGIQNVEFSNRALEEELSQLDKLHLDGELDIEWQQEKILQSELTLLRSKVANCETELLQCKNKIRLLMDEILEAKRRMMKEVQVQQVQEAAILSNLEDLQKDIHDAVKNYESKLDTWEKLNEEVQHIEQSISLKKKQADSLIQDLKEANLESLIFVPSEEISQFLEGGLHKGLGSSRKMIGSPRQLENAVPTSKNPHGVWV